MYKSAKMLQKVDRKVTVILKWRCVFFGHGWVRPDSFNANSKASLSSTGLRFCCNGCGERHLTFSLWYLKPAPKKKVKYCGYFFCYHVDCTSVLFQSSARPSQLSWKIKYQIWYTCIPCGKESLDLESVLPLNKYSLLFQTNLCWLIMHSYTVPK